MLDWSVKFRIHVTIKYVYENIISNLSIIFNFTLSNANHLRQKLYDKITYINSVHSYSLLMVNITKIKHTEFDYLPLRFTLSDTILSVLSIFEKFWTIWCHLYNLIYVFYIVQTVPNRAKYRNFSLGSHYKKPWKITNSTNFVFRL